MSLYIGGVSGTPADGHGREEASVLIILAGGVPPLTSDGLSTRCAQTEPEKVKMDRPRANYFVG